VNTIAVAKDFLPGSVGFLLAGVSLGAILLYGPAGVARFGRRCITTLVLAYLALAMPVVALRLEASLGRRYEADDPRLSSARAIVVLGSGSATARASGGEINVLTPQSAFSTLEAIRVYRLLEGPLVIASGGAPIPDVQLRTEAEVIRDELIRSGIPADRIVLEPDSLNTHDQAVKVSAIIRERKIGNVALVASRTHLPRALALFRAQGLDPVPSASALRSDNFAGWTARPWPSLGALDASRMVLYHYLAMGYARARGWTDREEEARGTRDELGTS
jgi:uncharacterized SAM-binding protein YcdF (DUF218 family)